MVTVLAAPSWPVLRCWRRLCLGSVGVYATHGCGAKKFKKSVKKVKKKKEKYFPIMTLEWGTGGSISISEWFYRLWDRKSGAIVLACWSGFSGCFVGFFF